MILFRDIWAVRDPVGPLQAGPWCASTALPSSQHLLARQAICFARGTAVVVVVIVVAVVVVVVVVIVAVAVVVVVVVVGFVVC